MADAPLDGSKDQANDDKACEPAMLALCPRQMPSELQADIEALLSFRNVEAVEFWHAFQAWGAEAGLFRLDD